MAQYTRSLIEKFDAQDTTPTWPWRLLVLSVVIFGFMLLTYLGLAFGYRAFVDAQIASIDQSIEQLAQEVPVDQQQALLRFYSQVANLDSLLAQHVFSSKVFPLFERSTNTSVVYTKLELDVDQRSVVLDGFATSYAVLAQQLEAYRILPEVDRYSISESRRSEGRIAFKATLFLNPSVFK